MRSRFITVVCCFGVAACSLDVGCDGKTDWDRAIAEAAVADPAVATPPLTPLVAERVRLVTWKKLNDQPLPVGPYSFNLPLWATVDGELRAFCRHYAARHAPDAEGLQSRIEKLLGLREGDGKGRTVITFEVRADQVFRPCPDPTIDTISCPVTTSENAMKSMLDKDPTTTRFLLEHMLRSYVQGNGYPFTRRGFTFDWDASAKLNNHFGLSEYVVRPNAGLDIVSVAPSLNDYCARE